MGSVQGDASVSVHLDNWPEFEAGLIDEKLNREMALVMKLVSLGHAARNKANRKVRQPLAEVAFSVGSAEEQSALLRYEELITDELNVKKVRALSAAGEAVAYAINPLPKQLGQKYGSRFPAIRKALLDMDAEKAAKTLLAGDSLPVEVAGEIVSVLPEEVEVRAQARAGFAVASEGAYLAALVTDLTPELVSEGLAREFVRRVQDLRKTAELDIADRITVMYIPTPGLAAAVQQFSEYIMNETLALEMQVVEALPHGLPTVEDSFDGEALRLCLKKAG